MKKLFMRKTAGLLALILTVSMLVPIVAFAAQVIGNTFSYSAVTNTATGSITVDKDVYNKSGDKLTVSVYTPDGNYSEEFTAYYDSYVDGVYKYSLHDAVSSIFNAYDYLNFRYYYPGNPTPLVTQDVYASYGGGIGGGGTVVSGNTITVGANGMINATDLINAFTAGNGSATLNLQGEFALLPASALLKGTTLTLVAGDVTYTLPLSALNIEDLAASLGVSVDDLTIRVDIAKLADDAAKAVTDAVTKNGGKELVTARDFKITAIAGDKTKELNDFGTYLSRAFTLSATPDASANVVGVVYDPATSDLSFVPTSVTTTDGKTVATLKRTGNSIYSVISVDTKTFADLAGH